MQDQKKGNLKTKFKSSLKWNISGSFFYETTRVLNQIFLLSTMSPNNYGIMATTFSFIYFIMYLSEFGATQALPAFLNIFIKNKNNFRHYFIKLYLLPQIIIYLLASVAALILYKNSIFKAQNSILLLVVPATLFFEGIRSLLRRFLHNILETKKTVLIENILMTAFLTIIWLPYIITKQEISLNRIFITFLIISIISVMFFITYIFNFYKQIPNTKSQPPHKIIKRIIKTRLFSYSTHIGKNFFSGNFLTPFFAYNFGLIDAGIFNIANHIAESIKAITKAIIIFTGGGLFAKLKSESIKIKRNSFRSISVTLNNVMFPVLIFIFINNKFIFRLKEVSLTFSATAMTMLFFVITAIELFFMAYEQFYIVEEKVKKLFLFKLIEIIMFYGVISSKGFASPILILLGLLITKLINYAILATNAYANWKLKPTLKVNLNIIYASILLSLLFKFFISR